jgi:hypothetical protein
MQEMQNAHLTLAYQALRQMKEEDDPFIYGQAHHCLALSALYSQVTEAAIAYHEEAVKIAERNRLHILKDPGHMISDPAHLEASEVLERAVFLGSLLHMEIVLDMFGTKKRTLCYAIEEEFRYRFPVCLSDFPPVTWVLIRLSRTQKAFPFLFQVSPPVLRVRSVLLVKEASEMIDLAVKPGISQPDAPRFRILICHAINRSRNGRTREQLPRTDLHGYFPCRRADETARGAVGWGSRERGIITIQPRQVVDCSRGTT